MPLVKKQVRPRDIITKKSLRNAIRVDMALGGSTNTVLHLMAIAVEADVPLSLRISILLQMVFRIYAICNLRARIPCRPSIRAGGHTCSIKKAGKVP